MKSQPVFQESFDTPPLKLRQERVSGNKRKLTLGIMLDSYQVPAWAYSSIEQLVNSDYAEISLIIDNKSPGAPESKLLRLWKKRHRVVYDVFNKIDKKLYHREPDPFKLRDLREILSGTPVIEVKPIQKRNSDYFKISDVERIKEYDLDILVKMGFRTLRGEILAVSKYGIWSYHHGDNRINRGEPSGFWEVVEGWPETGSGLHILSESLNNGKVLYRSSFFTYPFSPTLNRIYYFWPSSLFLPRQVEFLYRFGEGKFYEEIERFNQEFEFYNHRQYKTPSNVLALSLIARLLAKKILQIFQRVFYFDQWFMMFDLENDRSLSFFKFKKLIPPKDRYWADPHVIQRDGRYYIFFEEYIYKIKKGHISVIEMDQKGKFRNPVRVLEKNYHLSYPFVFECEGKYYIVPESRGNKTIDLYECVNFPDKWTFKMTLMESVNAVDTTLLHYCGKWWLFSAIAQYEGYFPQVELFLFFSETLFTSKWTPHPLNPIVSNVKRARPAGRIFRKNGKIFRPSQDCSKMYGYGFDINEILLLSEAEYLERNVASARPHWEKRIKAIHTFANEGQLTVIDGCMKRRRCF